MQEIASREEESRPTTTTTEQQQQETLFMQELSRPTAAEQNESETRRLNKQALGAVPLLRTSMR